MANILKLVNNRRYFAALDLKIGLTSLDGDFILSTF